MPGERGVLGSFAEPEAATRAVRALRAGGWTDVRAAMPAPFPELVEALGKRRSRLGVVTFPGAILGLLCGILLTVGTSLAWPLVTGGKPIVSWPPFVIVIFEGTVLIGATVNLIALLVMGGRGGKRPFFPDAARFTQELTGIFAPGGDPALAERILRENGAREVTRVG